MKTLALCLFCKNEHQYLKEWLDYHFSIGVEHVFLYDNMSDIPLKKTVIDYVNKGLVTVERIKDTRQGRHCRTFMKCVIDHGKKFQWIGFTDTDEFIVMKDGSTDLKEFLKPYEKYAAIGLYWYCFGSNGHKKPTKSQILAYTKRSGDKFHANQHIKTIAQPNYIVQRACSDPHRFYYPKGYFAVDENFKKIPGAKGPRTSKLIQLNHYVLRSETEFKKKIERGGGNSGEKGRKGMNFFNSYDNVCNKIEDDILADQWKEKINKKNGTS